MTGITTEHMHRLELLTGAAHEAVWAVEAAATEAARKLTAVLEYVNELSSGHDPDTGEALVGDSSVAEPLQPGGE